MTSKAGEVDKGFLWKQEHLSPLPIPTGQPPTDILGLMWRKNETYLDIGSLSLAGAWMTFHSLSVLFFSVGIYALVTGMYLLYSC